MKFNRWALSAALAAALASGACARREAPAVAAAPSATDQAAQAAEPKLKATDLAGNWGFAAYHRPEDRERVVSVAEAQCSKPFVVAPGPSGGVVMAVADKAEPVEVFTRPGPEGYDILGGQAPGAGDREISWYDGRVLVMRYLDPETAGRYGTMVLVRCVEAPVAAAPAPGPQPPAPDVRRPESLPIMAVDPVDDKPAGSKKPKSAKPKKGKLAAHAAKHPARKVAGKPAGKPSKHGVKKPVAKKKGAAARSAAQSAPKPVAGQSKEGSASTGPEKPFGDLANPKDPRNVKSGP